MIVCPKCGKENQDHYKFCLGCGNELPRDVGRGGPRFPTPPAVGAGGARPGPQPPGPFAPAQPQQQVTPQQQAPFVPQTQQAPVQSPQPGPFAPMQGQPSPFAQPVASSPFNPAPQQPAQPPVAELFGAPLPAQNGPGLGAPVPTAMQANPLAAAAPVPVAQPAAAPKIPASCPQCGSPNPRGNRFCITCGFDMGAAPAQPPASLPSSPPSVPVPVQGPPSDSVQLSPSMSPPVNAAPTPQAQPRTVERGRLVLIQPNGSEGGHHPLYEGENIIGRNSGGVFAQDTYLSPRHATFTVQGQGVTVRDTDSLNGVYVRVERQVPVELIDGDVFRIGQEILRFEAFKPLGRNADGTERLGADLEGLVGKISLVTGRDAAANAFPVPVTGLYLGRERGDILFPEDGYVSGLHCQLAVQNGKLTMTDVGSSNGSYLRMRHARVLRNGDFLLLGQQLFRLQLS